LIEIFNNNLMFQALLYSPNKIQIKEVPIPEPSEGEVLIKVMNALTCGTDLKAFLRGHPLIPMPAAFGHEYSGIIVKIGKGVKNFKEGDAVMGVHTAPCHECFYCKKGLYNLCEKIMDTKALGAYADYMIIPSHVVKENLFIKPINVSFKEAALLEPLSCVVHPYKRISMNEIENAIIIGAGAIGLLHLCLLLLKGINVLVIDKNSQRLDIANKIGADTILVTNNDLKKLVYNYKKSIVYDLVVECTGQLEVWQQSIDLVRKGGIVILFGGCKPDTFVKYSTLRIHYDEITIMGSFHFTPEDVKQAYKIITEKRINLKNLITAEYPLKNIQNAFEALKAGKGIKFAIKP